MAEVIPKNEEYLYEDKAIIHQTDLQGSIVYANRKFCEVTGYSVDNLLGMSYDLVVHPDMPKEVLKKMHETIKSGRTWNGIIKSIRKDGLFYWVEIEILPVRDDDGKHTGYIAVGNMPSRKDIKENEELYAKMLESQE